VVETNSHELTTSPYSSLYVAWGAGGRRIIKSEVEPGKKEDGEEVVLVLFLFLTILLCY